MAFTKLGAFSKKPSDLPDVPSPDWTPNQIRDAWQVPLDELKATQDKLVDDLNADEWVGTSKLTSKGVTREKISPGAIGINELDPSITSQPKTEFEVQAKFDSLESQLADNAEQINNAKGGFPNLQDRLDSIAININDYGAVGDGVTDDTTAFVSAKADVGEYGKIVLDPGKTYFTTETFEIGNTIIDGKGSKILTSATKAIHASGVQATTGKTLSVDYTKGSLKITLTDATGIEAGQILHMVSTELFDSSRSYYYKGGNLLVTLVSGNDVYLSHALPFNMTASSVSISTYTPKTPKIINLKVEHNGVLPAGTNGIEFEYCLFPELENVEVDNFVTNINFNRCVAPYGNRLITKRSYYTGSSTSYGILNESSTGLVLERAITNSGRHGFAMGGEEPCLNTRVRSSFILAESTLQSFDAHENNINLVVENVHTDSFKVGGTVAFKDCTFANTNYGYNHIFPSEVHEQANYTLDNCRFLTAARIRLRGDKQIASTTRNKMNGLHIKNCEVDVSLIVECYMEESFGSPIIADIKNITIENTQNVSFQAQDAIDTLIMDNTSWSADSSTVIQTSSVKGKINHVILRKVKIASRFKAIVLENFGVLELHSCSGIDLGKTDGGLYLNGATSELYIYHSDLSALARGIEVVTALNRFTQSGSRFNYYPNRATAIGKITNVGGEWKQDTNGVKYYLTVSTAGAVVASTL